MRTFTILIVFIVLSNSVFSHDMLEHAHYTLEDLLIAEELEPGRWNCDQYSRREHYQYNQYLETILSDWYGGYYFPYTGEWVESYRNDNPDINSTIEHIVALREAHESGLCLQSIDTRMLFARDLLNLTLASYTINSQKSSKDFAEWQPEANVCWFADRIIQVKGKYGLTVDRNEYTALEQTIRNCSSFALYYF